MRVVRIVFGVTAFLCLIPVFVLIGVSLVANHYGCRVHEGFATPCIAGNTDIGETLYALGMSGWLLIVTIPLLACLAIVWIIVEVVNLVRSRAATKA
jgi:hypothetical protein